MIGKIYFIHYSLQSDKGVKSDKFSIEVKLIGLKEENNDPFDLDEYISESSIDSKSIGSFEKDLVNELEIGKKFADLIKKRKSLKEIVKYW